MSLNYVFVLFLGKYVKGDSKKPLHQCNFYGSYAAGDKLKEMLKLGSSKPWKEVMAVMTGEPRMNTDAIREYFKPLEAWLKKENQKNGVKVGWNHDPSNIMCEDKPRPSVMKTNFQGNEMHAFI